MLFKQSGVEKIRTALIDDGVDWHTANKFRNAKTYFYEVENGQVVKQKGVRQIFLSSHGTRCFAIYSNTVKDLPNFDLYSIKTIDINTQRASIDDLETALNWCLEQRINIISISLGTTYFMDMKRLTPVIKALTEQGTIIVGAHNNYGRMSYPATSYHVIGARCDYTEKLLDEGQYIMVQNTVSGTDVISSCKYTGLSNKIYGDEIENYNSYAAPFVAGLVHRALHSGRRGISEVVNYLDMGKTVIDSFSWWKYVKKGIELRDVIESPIIAFENSSSSEVKTGIMRELCNEFIKEGYNAYSLCLDKDDDYFQISIKKLYDSGLTSFIEIIKYVLFYTQANILLVEITESDVLERYADYIDLLIGEFSTDKIPQIGMDSGNIQVLYDKIKKNFE